MSGVFLSHLVGWPPGHRGPLVPGGVPPRVPPGTPLAGGPARDAPGLVV